MEQGLSIENHSGKCICVEGGGGGVGQGTMNTRYETERLVLEVFPATKAALTLKFYLDNRELFEKYEPEHGDAFYTEKYQRDLLQCEYNLMAKLSMVRFWVTKKGEGEELLGTVSLQNIKKDAFCSCELGYKFGRRFWGQGYAQESVSKCLWIAFQELGLHRVEAQAAEENLHSKRLLRRLGFEWEGVRKQNVKIHGEWRDHELYALLSPFPCGIWEGKG